MTNAGMPALVVLCALLSSGCGSTSSYSPQEPSRIHFVKTDSGLMLEKDGKRYSTSGFWGGCEEAVADDADAEAHARTYVRRTRSTGIVLLVALALVVPSALLATNEPGHPGRNGASIGFGAAAMTAGVVAAMMPLLARPHLLDAVNIYNDHLASRKATNRSE